MDTGFHARREVVFAVTLREHGRPEVLSWEEVEDPTPGPGEVLVAMKAVALNHLDLWVRRGLPHLKLAYPHIPGSDGAGVVQGWGEGVEGLEVGQRVLINPGLSCGHCEACLRGRDNLCRQYHILGESTRGLCSELAVVPRTNILPYPEGVEMTDAAAIPLTFMTAWQMLVDRAQLKAGEWVLIQGGGSGVGSAGIQIAKMLGATVITTASTDEKLEKAAALGADHGIRYTDQDVRAEVRRLTGKRGVDVVFEHVGAAVWSDSIRSLTWGGRLVTCGATSGFKAETDLRHVFFRQLSILGSTMGSKGSLFEILRHIEAGHLRPVVDRVMKMSEASAAHEVLESRQAFGKVVLVP